MSILKYSVFGQEAKGMQGAFSRHERKGDWTKTAMFFSFTVAMACIFTLAWLSKDTGAVLGLNRSGGGVYDALVSLEQQAPLRGINLEVSVDRKVAKKGPFAYRWWLNGHMIEGYNKRTFPGMGLKKGDDVWVDVLSPKGEVVAKKRMAVVNSPLSLSN